MTRSPRRRAADLVAAALCAGLLPAAPAQAQGMPVATAFTYQGRLTESGSPAAGRYDFFFQLFDAESAGGQVGPDVERRDVEVTGGIFTVSIDFGAVFTDRRLWLGVQVRPAGGSAFAPLAGRQELTPAPTALYAARAGNATSLGGLLPDSYRLSGDVIRVVEGGTGATDAAGARANLQAAKSGANSDITSLSGLTTPLSVAQGGTGGNSVATSAFQARVSGTCPPGASMQSINDDGSVNCTLGFAMTPVDSAGRVGTSTSITVGADGRGLISYWDQDHGTLKVAHCSDVACTAVTSVTIDNALSRPTSITIGTDGYGLISYSDRTDHLKTAHCQDVTCSLHSTATVSGSGRRSSITMGTDGRGLISHVDGAGTVKVAHCLNPECSDAESSIIDTGANPLDTSITIGADGFGLVTYATYPDGYLIVAHCQNVACGSSTRSTLDSSGVALGYVSVTVGNDRLGLISFGRSHGVGVAHCQDTACTTATVSSADSAIFGSYHTSIAIGADGLGVISYVDAGIRVLRVAHCSDTACTTASGATLDGASNTGDYNSITIGPDGLPLVSYYDAANLDLKVAHCANVQCYPFVVRRR